MILSFIAAFILAAGTYSPQSDLDKAILLFENGLYSQAMDAFQFLPQYGSDPVVDGYATLCACHLQSRGYETMAKAYLHRHPACYLCDMVRYQQALDYFDKKEFKDALEVFGQIDVKAIPENLFAEYHFKTGYSSFKCEDNEAALEHFAVVDAMIPGDYSAPSQFSSGYIKYNQADFNQALVWFEKSVSDERFTRISNYYIVNCHYELDDYNFVVENGVPMLEEGEIPQDRKSHLARILSESYLLLGNKEKARELWDISDDGSKKYRADFFFEGSLMYTTGNWQGAIDSYSQVVDQRDSLSQIAYYQMAFSYLNTKNRVAALDAFKNATDLSFDPKMTEDAFFNYAKLAFDLNGDTSVFGRYMNTYQTKVRGEKIYSYMALASLQNRDYQAAIDFYDRIDALEGRERQNYVNANYLRGAELMESGSYRRAADCMKAVTYYSPKNDIVNQLARYCLAEACYSDGDYALAQNYFAELYNASALYGMAQGGLLAYNAAWASLKQQKYEQAIKWFDLYLSTSNGEKYAKDALLRKADCQFAMADYSAAAKSYSTVIEKYKNSKDLYPLFRCAVATGLISDPDNKTRQQKDAQKQKNLQEKLKILAPVTDADPSYSYYAEAMFEYGKAQLMDRKQTPAVRTFLKLADKAPKSPYAAKALLEIGTVRRGNGNIKGAITCYKRVVEKMDALGYTDDALLALESIYQSENAPQKYLAYLESIGRGNIKSESDKQAMIYDAALQIFYSGNYQRALSSFESFKKEYSSSPKLRDCDFFIGECFRKTSDKVRACDSYRKVIDGDGKSTYRVDAIKHLAALSYELENFSEAFAVYEQLQKEAPIAAVKSSASLGMMRSAYKAKNYQEAVGTSLSVRADVSQTAAVRREASMILAKSYLALSQRNDALAIMTELASDPKTEEGAQAAYFVIQDCYERADYGAIQSKVYAFADSGTKYQYYLAKAFIILGDSFAEQGNLKQAKATFQSIADGYEGNDDVAQEVGLRLEKLKEL